MTHLPQKEAVKKLRRLYKERRQYVDEKLLLKKAYRELQDKYNHALDRLETIASGMHYPGEVSATWSNDTKLQVTAAKTLEKLAKMPHTKIDLY